MDAVKVVVVKEKVVFWPIWMSRLLTKWKLDCESGRFRGGPFGGKAICLDRFLPVNKRTFLFPVRGTRVDAFLDNIPLGVFYFFYFPLRRHHHHSLSSRFSKFDKFLTFRGEIQI